MIRKNNVGGYYFTVLEEYTKYILENNSIEIYKEELRQKARELISFREKFQSLIDSKLDENDRLLNKSDSRGSLLNRSRTKYMGSSRNKSGSEISKEDGSRIKEYLTAGNRMSVGSTIPPQVSHQVTGRNDVIQTGLPSGTSLSPMLATLNQHHQATSDRPRTSSSTITYTPYNKDLIPQATTPTQQSFNTSRVQVTHTSSTSSNYVTGNGFTPVSLGSNGSGYAGSRLSF